MEQKDCYDVLNDILIDILDEPYLGDNNTHELAYYCSASTAYSVIDHEEIWMRKTTCMNDYKEFEFGLLKLDMWFREKDTEITKCLSKLNIGLNAKDLHIYIKGKLRVIQNQTYIACLTKHPKEEDELGRLSMWRAYGRNSGTAIVFNKDNMRSIFCLKSGNYLVLLPVKYLSPKDNYNNLFNKLIEQMEENMDGLKGIDCSTFIENFLLFCLVIIATVKHKGFEEEAEMRYIYCCINHSDVDEEYDKDDEDDKCCLTKCVENINGIPQIIYKLSYAMDDNNPLSKIIIGPNEFPDVINDAFVDLLKRKGINNPENYIQETSIPLRV